MAGSQIDSGADITGDAVADTGLQTLGHIRGRRQDEQPPASASLYPSTVTYPSPTTYPGA
jgi:hypothetical protein